MSSQLPPLSAAGERVVLRTVQDADVVPYGRAVQQSADRIGWWNPVDPRDIIAHLQRQSDQHRTFIVHARQPIGDHDIVGKINVSNVIRGRFQSATIGYDSYDPYVGTGLFAEGMRLMMQVAFAPEPSGMGLHRLEANVQPANTRSAGLLRSLGFRRERHVRNMLWLDGTGRATSWRDHDSYAITAGEPTDRYRSNQHPRVVVLVNGLPGSGKTSIAGRLANELGIPLWSKDIVKETMFDGADEAMRAALTSTGPGAAAGRAASLLVWRMLSDSVCGGVLDNNLRPENLEHVRAGLRQADYPSERVLQIWCDVPAELAKERSLARRDRGQRHPVHGDRAAEEAMWAALPDIGPLPIGRTIRVNTTAPVDDSTIARLALEARAVALG